MYSCRAVSLSSSLAPLQRRRSAESGSGEISRQARKWQLRWSMSSAAALTSGDVGMSQGSCRTTPACVFELSNLPSAAKSWIIGWTCIHHSITSAALALGLCLPEEASLFVSSSSGLGRSLFSQSAISGQVANRSCSKYIDTMCRNKCRAPAHTTHCT